MRDTGSFLVESHRGPYVVRREPLAAKLPTGLLPADRLVVDREVQALHPTVADLAGREQTYPVTASERLKSLDGSTPILAWLLDSGFSRSGTLYAIGGGTVQDATCFIASILHRGARWVFVPTTLISQGDSCIGGKSSINHGGYKNQLGTFYPPAEIVIDDDFLKTLAPGAIRSGVGELLHYAVIGDETVFAAYETSLTDGWEMLSTGDMTNLAMWALAVKRPFIEADEFDTGHRKTLNFGHTFGHALEFASRGQVPHGVAVAYGIDMANAYAESRGILARATRDRIGKVLRKLVDGSELIAVRGSELLAGMSRDKKRSNGDIELVLIEDLGRPLRLVVPLDDHLRSFFDNYLATWHARGSRGSAADVGRA